MLVTYLREAWSKITQTAGDDSKPRIKAKTAAEGSHALTNLAGGPEHALAGISITAAGQKTKGRRWARVKGPAGDEISEEVGARREYRAKHMSRRTK